MVDKVAVLKTFFGINCLEKYGRQNAMESKNWRRYNKLKWDIINLNATDADSETT